MTGPEAQALIDEANAEKTLDDSAAVIITGLAGKFDAAIARAEAAEAADVNAEQVLADLKSEVSAVTAAMKDNKAPLAAAVAAQTPAAPATPTLTIGGNTGLAVGDTSQFTASASDGSTVTSWASLDTSVVTVDANGIVTAVGAGSTKITATTGTASAAVNVSVS